MSSKTFSSSCVQLLARSSVQSLLSCLADHGVEGRLVGGCVRDALLGQAISDIDVAVNASPHVVQQLLEREGFKVIPTGLKHGTLTVLVEKEAFELTSLRRDVITDGRHATVAYTTDWREDAARRDFTINALYLSSDGTLTDFFGGQADLAQGLVRFIGDPDQRICEDFLRILRYYRFVQRFGGIAQETLDKRSHAAVRRHNQSLPNLSKERIQSELFKILEHERPQEIVRLMNDDGIFQALFKRRADEGGKFDRLIQLQDAFPLDEKLRILERLFLLFPYNREFYTSSLRLSRYQLDLLENLFKLQNVPLTKHNLFVLRHRYGNAAARIKVDLALARIPQANPGTFYKHLISDQPFFPLKGSDLLSLGLIEGKQIGALLKKVETFWLAHEGAIDKAACLDFARIILKKKVFPSANPG